MILQALRDYYDRKSGDAGIAPAGWVLKEIPFVVVLSSDGHLVAIDDMRHDPGGVMRAKPQLVPAPVKRSVNVAANLLWDSVEYCLGIPIRSKAERVKAQHTAFRARLEEVFGGDPEDEGLRALNRFLTGSPAEAAAGSPVWEELKTNPFISFRLERDPALICSRPAVRSMIDARPSAAADGLCLVTGQPAPVVRLHPAIKGVRGAQSSGGSIVSFNLDAFESYGKKQGANSPVGEPTTWAYTAALNHLLGRDSHQKLVLGDTTAVFWAEKSSGAPIEEAFGSWFDPPGDDPDEGVRRVEAVYQLKQGIPLTGDDEQRFYVLGLAPNAARISVRFWQVATIGELGERIFRYFSDLKIVLPPHAQRHPSMYWLLRSLAAQEDAKNVPPKLAGDWIRSILSGAPYPATLLQAAVLRCRFQRNVGPLRAAVIKACLNRSRSGRGEEMCVSLDTENANVGYRLGRLFAVFEKIQEEASPSLNVTIRDRYFSSASVRPLVAFPVLNRLKNHHLAKLENRGRAVNLERLVGEIAGGLDAVSPFPAQLSLADQGRFAVGYYHQRQRLFEKKQGGE